MKHWILISFHEAFAEKLPTHITFIRIKIQPRVVTCIRLFQIPIGLNKYLICNGNWFEHTTRLWITLLFGIVSIIISICTSQIVRVSCTIVTLENTLSSSCLYSCVARFWTKAPRDPITQFRLKKNWDLGYFQDKIELGAILFNHTYDNQWSHMN